MTEWVTDLGKEEVTLNSANKHDFFCFITERVRLALALQFGISLSISFLSNLLLLIHCKLIYRSFPKRTSF